MAVEVGSARAGSPARLAERLPAVPRGLGKADLAALVGILLAGVVAPALVALGTHSLGIPRDDDWAYRRVLYHFARTGHYSLVGWGAMTLVGQVLWASAFVLVLGERAWVPSLAVAFLAAGGLGACYLLARGQLGRRRAAACSLLVVSLPGLALSTSSFMTDVPAFSSEMLCLLSGALALRSSGRARLGWLGASMVAGVFGFSVREFSLAAPVAVLAALVWADRRLLRPCAFAGALAGAACLAIYLWSAGLPGAQPKSLVLPTATALAHLGSAYFTLSFMVLPVLPAAALGWEPWRRPAGIVAAGAALGAGALLVLAHYPLFIGNYLDQQGAGGGRVLAGTRPELFPAPLWEAFRALALAGGTVLAGVLASAGTARLYGHRRGQGGLGPLAQGLATGPQASERRLVLVFTWLSVALLAGYALLVKAAFWDRYLWPVAFGCALLALAGPERLGLARADRPLGTSSGRAVGLLLGALVGLVALAITLNSDAFDAARWSAGKELVAAGYPAATVDAGFDWVGAHEAGRAQPGRTLAGAPGYETWYDQMFPGLVDCALVSSSPLSWPLLRLYRSVTYDELAVAWPEHLFLYTVDSPSCAAARL